MTYTDDQDDAKQPTGIPDRARQTDYVDDPDEFMQTARDRYAMALAEDKDDRAEAEQDTDFVGGDQWDAKAKGKRKKARRPILTWNRLQTFVAQVVNDGRENKPAIRTSAMDGGNKRTAEFYQSRIRHLEYECDADIAYDTTREQQVVSGRAFIRVSTEYQPKSFDQRLSIDAIDNQFSVLFEPTAIRYDRTDADWCFVFSTMSRDAYERKYGKTAAAKANYFAGMDNPAPEWMNIGPNGEQVQVAEYWLKQYTARTLCLLEDGTSVYEDELKPGDEARIKDTRIDHCCVVMQYLIDGVEILDATEWIGSTIPIVPVWGKQMVIQGRRRNFSLVRFAKDPQRLVNLYVSNIAEQIAQMPKTPYIGAEGQFLGREGEWETINEDPRAFVQYKAKAVDGNLVGAPQRVVNEPPIQALTLGLNQAIDAIKAAMGIYDAALGAQSNETSGLAIERRKKESDVANFHFPDNEARSRKAIGRILLELIPILDKGPREVPTRSEDGKVTLVKVNQVHRDEKTGETYTHNLSAGNYDIAVSTGPSYTSQRREANDAYAQIASADKNFMTIAGDLYFRTSDMPGAEQIADRYEKMLPAQLAPPKPQSEQQAAQQQAALQQLAAQHQQQTAIIHQLSTMLEQKQVEASSRERIAAMQTWATVRVAAMKLGNASAIADSDREASRLEGIFDRAHQHALASVGADAETEAASAEREHATQMQQNEHEQQAAQQQSQQDAQAQQAAQQQPVQK